MKTDPVKLFSDNHTLDDVSQNLGMIIAQSQFQVSRLRQICNALLSVKPDGNESEEYKENMQMDFQSSVSVKFSRIDKNYHDIDEMLHELERFILPNPKKGNNDTKI